VREQVTRLLPATPQLKSELTSKQLSAALHMLQRGVSPLPEHWFVPPTTQLALPRPGALEGHSTPLRKTGGRNHHGKITVRHRGGGRKRRIRILDRVRQVADDAEWRVERLEHDPNRSAKIALVRVSQGGCESFRYVLAAEGMDVGATLRTGPGTTAPLQNTPLGTLIHNVETRPGCGGVLVRAAGTFATLVGKDSDQGGVSRVTVRLPSGRSIKLPGLCRASLGRVGNVTWGQRVLGTAGRVRRLGRRPKVRGVAMNAVDHPHGGGKGGRGKGKPSQSLWGWVCK